MDWVEFIKTTFMSLYTIILAVVCLYGFHRYVLVCLFYRHRKKKSYLAGTFEDLPRVTVQLPMYNERFVARRIIKAACNLDYPADKIQIQVLDDSTDDTHDIARELVEEKKQDGHDIEYIHRENRAGFKAGALANGMKNATGEYIAIFDADFIPDAGFLKNTIHYFTDPGVCAVQTRWEHINSQNSLLTKSQAIFLDGHFSVEHIARNKSGRFMNFNGTGGAWRRSAIEDAGGWKQDTLTEDLDLSYRAQLKGWKFVYLPEMTSPAELPPDMKAFKAQQFRWTKGGTQNAINLLPKVLLSKMPLKVKVEAFFQLTAFCLHIFMFALVLLMFPAMFLKCLPIETGGMWRVLVDMGIFSLATMSVTAFYCTGQMALGGNWYNPIKYGPVMMAIGVGLCVSNTKAIIEALFGRESGFVRTPKYGEKTSSKRYSDQTADADSRRKKRAIDWLPCVEFGLGMYMIICIIVSLFDTRAFLMIPFLSIFSFGFFYVSLLSFRAAPAPAEGSAVAVPVYNRPSAD